MTRFLTNIAIYLTAVICIIYLGSNWVSDKYWSNRIPIKKSLLDFSIYDTIQIVLGSSHTFYGINSNMISDNCYNMASVSQGFYEDFTILKKIQSKQHVEAVILPMSYFSNHHYMSDTDIDGEFNRIYDYEKTYQTKYPVTYKYIVNKILLHPAIIRTYLSKTKKIQELDSKGNLKINCSNKPYRIEDAKKTFEEHNKLSNFSKTHPFLDSVINYCQIKNIRLYIVIMPFTKEYQKLTSRENTGFKPFVEKLEFNSAGKFKMIDAEKFFNDDETIYFQDSDHLSPCGRDIFSAYLGGEIKRLNKVH